MIALAKPDNVIAMPTKSNEWYTPARYVEAARSVMGSIDLDPASCKEANMVVKAARYFTQHDNGLAQDWIAKNVWLNPPYSSPHSAPGKNGGQLKGQTGLFLAKLIRHVEQGDIQQAIICVNADTNRSWFRPLWEHPICFADHKIWFNRPNLPPQGQFFGAVFVYFGTNEQRFIDIFSEFGPVARRVSKPKVQSVTLSLWGDA